MVNEFPSLAKLQAYVKKKYTMESHLDINDMRKAGKIVAEGLSILSKEAKIGTTTSNLNDIGTFFLRQIGCTSAFKGNEGYPCSIITSTNEEIMYGIPSPDHKLQHGDVLKIGFGVRMNGIYVQSTISLPIGFKSLAVQLCKTSEAACNAGISTVKAGTTHIGDIGFAIQKKTQESGFRVIKGIEGSGIGRSLCENPLIPGIGVLNDGPLLIENQTIYVCAAISIKSDVFSLANNKLTRVTSDGGVAAMFGHTIIVTQGKAEILTSI